MPEQMGDLWSNSGSTVFDWYTIVHLAFWILMGAFVSFIQGRRDRAFIVSITGAVVWKVARGFIELALPSVEKTNEIPMNALVDICMCPLGLLIIWSLIDGRKAQ
jgi:hypothetical protein